MAASSCVHDRRTEVTNDESPRSPDKKRDHEKSEPKRDTTPYARHRPEAAKREDRKEQGDGRPKRSEKHFTPPFLLCNDRRPHRSFWAIDWRLTQHRELGHYRDPALRGIAATDPALSERQRKTALRVANVPGVDRSRRVSAL